MPLHILESFIRSLAAQVTTETSFRDLLEHNPWLKGTKLVVKPDMLFGKRGKHDLVGLNLDVSGVENFVHARLGKAGTSTLARCSSLRSAERC